MKKEVEISSINRIAFIGNYLPRQCGIATFTTDLCEAVAEQYKEPKCIALAVNDVAASYAYPQRVKFELDEKDIDSYLRASDFLNINNVDIVCLQFEYGIFGGKVGSHILALLRGLRMPVVTTLHTILKNPNNNQRRVLEEVAALSDRIVVMSERGSEFLQTIYNVPRKKIDLIHHGIPDVPFVDSSFNKDLFGVEGKTVLLSFGLLSPSKGIENVISAMPEILKQYPDCVYIIVGATHPNVIKNEGETYRLSLQWLARQKGVEGNVIFYNRFVSIEELVEFISAADIYITPYLNEAQITSGTLAYTLGAGKAIVSTPYWYAEELLADGRGLLVPFNDCNAIAKQVISLLDNDSERSEMRKRAYNFGRKMIWPEIAQRYMESFELARKKRGHNIESSNISKSLDKYPGQLPILKLDHLEKMTDYTGMIQHALFTVPNYAHGYSTDDNARALLVSILLEQLGVEKLELSSRYLAFLGFAYNDETNRFRNFMDYQRNWLENSGSDDCHGRSILALGTVISHSNTHATNTMASWLFEKTLSAILLTTSPRAWAFALIGICVYLQKFEKDTGAQQVRDELAGRLMSLYRNNQTDEWCWFEKELSYCNAVLPHALLMSGKSIHDVAMTDAGLKSLKWLADIQISSNGNFIPIGSNGFYKIGGERAQYDQQPVEAQAMVSASLEAFRITGDTFWKTEARRAFEWYLGRNEVNLQLYDPTTGGCRDGLHSDRSNENQGAESTLAFLQSLLELKLAEQVHLSMEALKNE